MKRQKRHPTAENPLDRFDKPIPNQRSAWVRPTVTPDANTPEETENPWDQENDAKEGDEPEAKEVAGESEGGSSGGIPNSRRVGTFTDGELPDRLRLRSERLASDEGEGPAPLTRENLKALRKKYQGLASSDPSTGTKSAAASRDFRKAHREAVKEKGRREIVDFEMGGGEKRAARPIPVLWIGFAGAGLIVGLAVILSGALGGKTERVQLNAPDRAAPMAELPTESIEQVVERYFGAETWTDLLRDVRRPEFVKPLMESWYAAHPYKKQEFEITNVREGMMSTGGLNDPGQLWIVHVGLRFSDTAEPAFILLERESDGFKVDWESTVGFEELPFDEFASREGSPASEPVDFRVTMEPADYYNYSFSDKETWVCFLIRAPHSPEILHGYLKRGSDLEESTNALFYPGEKLIPVIAALKFPDAPSKETGQVEIVDVLQKNWILRHDGAPAPAAALLKDR